MIVNWLKDVIKYTIYKVKYLNSNIGFGSRISDSSNIGNNTIIKSNSIIYQSDLGDNTTINEFSNITKSTLGESIKVKKFTVIANSKIYRNVIIDAHCNIDNVILNRFNYVANNCQLNLVKLGAFSYIADSCKLNLVEFGNFCSVGSNLICGYGNHPVDFVSTNPVFYSTLKQCGISFSQCNLFQERKKITVGHDVWIGARVFIKDGVKIGNGAIIGAGAIVIKNVPDFAIVGGVPAKLIRFRFSNKIIQKLLEIKWWYWSEEKLQEAQPLFANKDIFSFIEWAENNKVNTLENKNNVANDFWASVP